MNQPTTQRKKYLVQVTETVTTFGVVAVEAATQAEAEELAEDQFDSAEHADGTRETQSMIVGDDGWPVGACAVAEPWPLMFAYTRRMAIADGVLIDVSATAAALGFRASFAMTAAVWTECVVGPPGVSPEDERGRLCDVLWMTYVAIRVNGYRGTEFRYQLRVRTENRDGTPPLVELKAVCGPDDDGDPCVTIMTPAED